MTTSDLPSTEWTAIRSLVGGPEKSFEELCAQLARLETPKGIHFTRNGIPDGGVECYATFPDGTRWGWQAKYFIAPLGDTQWKQIGDSVKNAIKNYTKLVRYYICVPRDLSNGHGVRKSGTRNKSEMDRWKERVKEWQDLSQAKGRTIDFFLWGSSELRTLLFQKPERSGLVYFWFNQRVFDAEWFSARLKEALQSAGPRYTPEVHVELPITQKLDAFGRTPQFFNRIKDLAIPIRGAFQRIHSSPPIDDADVASMTKRLLKVVQAVLDAFSAIKHTPIEPLPFDGVLKKLEETKKLREALSVRLEQLARVHDAQPRKERSHALYRANPFRDRLSLLWELAHELQDAAIELGRAEDLARSSVFVLKGDAGIGKTHLLCDVARRRVHAEQPTVLLMGQRFMTDEPPWTQLIQHLGLSVLSVEKFIGALESAAQVRNERALIVIDALNESKDYRIWRHHLASFLEQIKSSPWLGVVLSVRSSYEDEIFSEAALDREKFVTHQGFDGHEYDATKTFFSYYGLELPSIPLLNPEFRNPLFLKMLCVGAKNQGLQRLPRGLRGITTIFKNYLEAVNKKLAYSLGDDPIRVRLVRRPSA